MSVSTRLVARSGSVETAIEFAVGATVGTVRESFVALEETRASQIPTSLEREERNNMISTCIIFREEVTRT